MKIDKREVRREAKARITPKGIFAVRCAVSGEAWVGSSCDLISSRTGTWFMLRNGMQGNRQMQSAWTRHGAEAFQFDVLETLDDDLPPMVLKDSLGERQKYW